MGKGYVYHCTLCTFGMDRDMFNRITSDLVCDGVELQFWETNLLGKLVVGKNNVDNYALESVLKPLYKNIKDYLYADYDVDLNECLVNMLIDNGDKISVAESITGGLICSEICSVEGASKVLYEGLITYNSGSKLRRLHVPARIIEEHTSVSEATTSAMLNGLLTNKEIKFGIATTGYASNMEDMNGLAYVAYGSLNDQHVEMVTYSGDRNEIRAKVANYAMFKLLKLVTDSKNKY